MCLTANSSSKSSRLTVHNSDRWYILRKLYIFFFVRWKFEWEKDMTGGWFVQRDKEKTDFSFFIRSEISHFLHGLSSSEYAAGGDQQSIVDVQAVDVLSSKHFITEYNVLLLSTLSLKLNYESQIFLFF